MAQRFWPLARGTFTISSGFGPRIDPITGARADHQGLDFAATIGTPIYAPCDGWIVEGAERQHVDGFGRWVWLDAQRVECVDVIVGHCDPLVRRGQIVRAGQLIGRVNTHGDSTGPHAHVEVWLPPGRDGGHPTDPAAWLRHAAYLPAPSNTGGKPMSQLVADVTMLTAADSGWRDPHACQLAVLHTNEGPAGGSLEGLLSYLQDTAHEASYNVVVAGDGRIGRSNDDDYSPWAAGWTANKRGLHLCLMGFAADLREAWLARPQQLAAAGRVLRSWHDLYGVPLVRIGPDQVRAGQRGVCGHVDTSAAWGETDHTDPGVGLPYDVILGQAVRA